MDTKELIEVLQTNIEDQESVRQLITASLGYLEQIENTKVAVRRPKFTILARKLLTALKKHYKHQYSKGLEENTLGLADELDRITKRAQSMGFINTPDRTGYVSRVENFTILAEKFENSLLSLISKISDSQANSSSFYDLYIPEGANRLDAERLIQDAIQIIRKDISLTPEARKKIISQLETALSNLRKGDLKDFFGTVKEVVIILGALGLLAGGYYAAISQAQDKINDAVGIIEKTSINHNFKVLGYKPSCFSDAYLLESKDREALPPSPEANETKVLQATLETTPDHRANSQAKTNSKKEADDFLQWVANLPQTDVNLDDEAFERGDIYE